MDAHWAVSRRSIHRWDGRIGWLVLNNMEVREQDVESRKIRDVAAELQDRREILGLYTWGQSHANLDTSRESDLSQRLNTRVCRRGTMWDLEWIDTTCRIN